MKKRLDEEEVVLPLAWEEGLGVDFMHWEAGPSLEMQREIISQKELLITKNRQARGILPTL